MDESIGLKKSGCHGFCEMGPLLRIEPMGWLYLKVKARGLRGDHREKYYSDDEVVDRLVYQGRGSRKSLCKARKIFHFIKSRRVSPLNTADASTPRAIAEYIALGGYSAVGKGTV